MPYLLLSLEIFSFILTLFIGGYIFFILIKRLKEIEFLKVFKTFLLYELVSLSIYRIYPFHLFTKISGNEYFLILDSLIFIAIMFFIFHFLIKKTISIDFKKSLIIFLLLILILLPLLDGLRGLFVRQIAQSPIFEKEKKELEAQIEEYGLFWYLFYQPSYWKIVEVIEEGTLSWPSKLIFEVSLFLFSK